MRHRRENERSFAAARGHALDALDRAMTHDQRVVEIVHRRTDVPRQEVEKFPDGRNCSTRRHLEGKMLLGRLQRRQLGPPEDHTGRYARVSGYAFVARVAGDDVRGRVADHARYNHYSGPQTVFCGGLRETRSVTIDDRSEEHTSELQSPCNLVCRLLLEKKKKHYK